MRIIECPKCGPNISNNTEESEFCWICKSKLIKYDETPEQIKTRKALEKQKEKIEDNKRMIATVKLIFILMILGFVVPSLLLLIYNFFKLVVLGDMQFSEFSSSWSQYSYNQVENFYINIREWFKALSHRLNN